MSERIAAPPRWVRGVFAATIFLSAFLLFTMEPLVAKRILPWFGGSAAVWSTCLVFSQVALLLGYLYAHLSSRFLAPKTQAWLHLGLLLVSLLLLPIGPGEYWKPGSFDDPSWFILRMLAATVGMPFAVLSATSPLLQTWLSQSGETAPYRLFAFSNLASLLALAAYPIVVEPELTTSSQRVWWSCGFAVFVVTCGFSAWQSRKAAVTARAAVIPVTTRQAVRWLSLSACGSMLLLSVTNHINENVAPIPLLWILPLAIYLLSFVLTFGSRQIYRRGLWLRLLAFALGMIGYAVYDIRATEILQVNLPIFLVGLLVCCMFCHGELHRARPQPEALSTFYLLVSAGGALGAILVGLVAPRVFSGIYELPLSLTFTAVLALVLTWDERQLQIRLLWVGVTGCMLFCVGANVKAYHENALSLRRSFYGSLRVTQTPRAGDTQVRSLFHGTIEHGAQYLWPTMRMHPTTYYGPDSGIGIVLRECFSGPKRVAMVGLGAGTTAAYGREGDVFRFYEINRQVIDIAQALFYYLRESKAAVQIVEGDARLSLERETTARFDVVALDAFSGDAIPVHLLTRQAMELYERRLKAGGVIAFHVSNQYLDLAPVVEELAKQEHLQAILVRNHGNDDQHVFPSDWVLVTNNQSVLENAAIRLHSLPIADRRDLGPWTDDYNNLFQILKAPSLK